MRFANADGAGEEQALPCGVDWICFDEFAGGLQSSSQRTVGFVVDLVVVEGAFAVALGNVRGGEAILFALHLLALAGAGDPQAGGGDFFDETDAAADGTCAHDSSKRSALDGCVSRCGLGGVVWKRRRALRQRGIPGQSHEQVAISMKVSTRPSGTRKYARIVVPGFRFAPAWATFVFSLREKLRLDFQFGGTGS